MVTVNGAVVKCVIKISTTKMSLHKRNTIYSVQIKIAAELYVGLVESPIEIDNDEITDLSKDFAIVRIKQNLILETTI